MFTHTQAHGVQISEGHSPLLRPADLPPPDHAIRICPWNLESSDASAQASQMNEEFASYNLDACFLLVNAPLVDLQEPLRQLGRELSALGSAIVEQDNGVLVAAWNHGEQTVLGFFDNGGVDHAQQLAVTSTFLDDFEVVEGLVPHFTTDTSQEAFEPFQAFFENLEPNRALTHVENVLSIPLRARMRR